MMSPLVSVVVPSYNHDKFLKERIESILNQTFQDFELIILDDLSPDNSREIIETYRTHPKVSQIVYNEKNSGSTFFQWNKAIFDLAQGEFIWIAESDDVAALDFLEKLVPILKNDPNMVLAYSQSARMDSNGNITGSWKDWTNNLGDGSDFHKDFFMNGNDYIYKFLIHQNTIPNASAVLFRKKAYINAKGADIKQKTTGDWDLWIKLLLEGNIYFKCEELNYFRYHDTSVIARSKKASKSKLFVKYCLLDDVMNMRISLEKYRKFNLLSNETSSINHRILRNIKIKKIFLRTILFFVKK